MSWNPVFNATAYNVKRSTLSAGPFATIASTLGATSFKDTAVANGQKYYYVLSAINIGGESPNSSALSATPQSPRTAPGNLIARANSTGQITLNWIDTSSNEQGFQLERSTDGVSFMQIANLVVNVTSYLDSNNLRANKLYYYRIRAFNAGGNCAYSNIGSAKT